jgi:protein phosphatase
MEGRNVDRIALISDIHGNIPALESVLQDIRRHSVQRIFCLGDLVGKGPHSDEAVDFCREECDVTIKGNWDDFIVSETDDPTLLWHQQRLGGERLDYLKNLPHTIEFYMSGKRVRLFHASQKGIHHRVHMNDTPDKHRAMFSNTDFTGNAFEPDVVGYGVGSVGNPLDLTQSSYAILEGEYGSRADDTFSIHLIRVPYDIELAIQQARDEGMPDLEPYENELRTARYRGAVASVQEPSHDPSTTRS